MVVDDEPDVLQLFGRILMGSGEGVSRAPRYRRGDVLSRCLHRRKPDIMLLDMVMPGFSGYERYCRRRLPIQQSETFQS